MDDRDNAEVWVLQEIEPPIEFADLSSGVDANHVEPHHHEYAINNKQSHPLIENSPEVGSIQTLQIRELIAPFLLVLRWGGLYFEFERKNLGLSKGTPKHREVINYGVRRKRHLYGKLFSQCGGQTFETFSFCLCSITLIISLIDESRLIYAFYAQLTNSPETPRLAVIVDNLETIKWAFQCLIVHFILMVMCYQNRFTVLFEAWENIRTRYPDSAAATRHYGFTGRFRRKQRIMVVVSFAVLALNCYSLFGPLFIPAEVYEDFKIYVMEPFRPDNALVKALIVVAMVFRSFDYVFSATLFLLISDAVVLQFTQFYNDLSAQISDEGILQNPARLEWHRLKHTRLCALVQRVDSIFSPYVLIGLVSGMFGILTQVFVIYDFSKENKMGGITVMSYVYWSLLNLVQVLVILWSGSKVNVAVSNFAS